MDVVKALYRKCKKRKKTSIAVLVMLFAFLAGGIFYLNRVPSEAVTKYQSGIANGHGVAFYNDEVPEEKAEKGTAENPFVVVEILTDKSYMEFGWLVEGCEPVPAEFMQISNGMMAITSHGDIGTAKQIHKENKGTDVYKEELSAYDDSNAWIEHTFPEENYYAQFRKGDSNGAMDFVYDSKKNVFKQVTPGTGDFSKVKEIKVDPTKPVYQRRFSNWSYTCYDKDASGNYTVKRNDIITGSDEIQDVTNGKYYILDVDAHERPAWTCAYGYVEGKTSQEFYGYYEYVGKNNGGNYNFSKNKYSLVKMNQGDYKFFPVEKYNASKPYNISKNPSDPYFGERFYVKANLLHYYEMVKDTQHIFYEYKNKNSFVNTTIRNAYELDDKGVANFHVVVCSLTVKELNRYMRQSEAENAAEGNNAGKWVERSDIIFMNCTSHEDSFRKMIASCYDDVEYTNGSMKYTGDNDLSWQSVMCIYNKVANGGESGDRSALVSGWGIIHGADQVKNVQRYEFGYDKRFNIVMHKCGSSATFTASKNNTYKLMVMLRSMDTDMFYNTFMKNYNNADKNPAIVYDAKNDTGYYKWAYDQALADGYSKDQAMEIASYWGSMTFMPLNSDGTESTWAQLTDQNSDLYKTYKMNPTFANGGSTVTGNIFMWNDDTGFYDSFLQDGKNTNNFTEIFQDWLDEKDRDDDTNAAVLEFLLGYQGNAINAKPTLKVLEIEPCNDFYLNEDFVRIMLPQFKGNIVIEQVTTAEFNGRIDNVCEDYDFIYIGHMNGTLTNDAGAIIDSTGLIYRKEGQQVGTSSGLIKYPMGNLVFDIATSKAGNQTIYSGGNITVPGNDITNVKYQELLSYIESGQPIVAENGIYKGDETKIGKDTNILKLKKKAGGEKNFVQMVYGPNNTLLECLSSAKPIITGTMPTEYATIDADSGNISYQYLSDRKLTFSFAVSDFKTTFASKNTYHYNIYVDLNGDGKFKKTSSVSTNELFASGTIVADNKTNTATVVLEDNKMLMDWNGALSWKLAVSNDKGVSSSICGVSAVKASEKTTLSILQIRGDDGVSVNPWDISADTLFQKWAGDASLADFKLDITSISLSEYLDLFISDKKFDNKTSASRIDTNKLAAYDLVVLGGGEQFYESDFKNDATGAIDNLEYFMTTGKRVVFLQNTVSYKKDGETGNTSVYLREAQGMDRFGVRTLDAMWLENGMSDDSSTKQLESFKKAYEKTMGKKELATTAARHGYTYGAVSTLSNTGVYNKFVNSSDAASTSYATSISKINDGQVSCYPYCITAPGQLNMYAPEVTVDGCSAQSYQLDLNASDTTVWYCLSDTMAGTGLYSSSPRDAVNNYYLVTTDKAAFINLGGNAPSTDLQMQLFINTLISAYKKTYDPYIDVLNGQKASKNLYYIYDVDDNYDGELKEENDYIDIVFVPQNPNHSVDGDAYSTANVSAVTRYTGETEDTELEFFEADGDDKATGAALSDSQKKNMVVGKTYIARYKKDTAEAAASKAKVVTFSITDADGHVGACNVKIVTRTMYNLD